MLNTSIRSVRPVSEDTAAIETYLDFINKSGYSQYALVKFNKTSPSATSSSEYEVHYSEVTGASASDICFNGLMYNAQTGCMYYSPESTYSFVPFIQFDELFSDVLEEVSGVKLNIPRRELFNFIQNAKLNRNSDNSDTFGKGTPGLLSELTTYLRASSSGLRSLLIGTDQQLPYTMSNESTLDVLRRISKFILGMIDTLVPALSKLTVEEASLIRTTASMCNSTEPILDTDEWTKIKDFIDTDKGPMTTELSTNIMFNDTALEYVGKMVNPNSKDGLAKGAVAREASTVVKVLNATDTVKAVGDSWYLAKYEEMTTADSTLSPSPNSLIPDYKTWTRGAGRPSRQINLATPKVLKTFMDIKGSNDQRTRDALDELEDDEDVAINPEYMILSRKLINAFGNAFMDMRY